MSVGNDLLYLSTPLHNATQQIRLLHIPPACEEDQLNYTLSVWSLHQHPDFRAISYMWGSETDLVTILVNRTLQRVTQNSSYALWQARHHYPGTYVWMDAICINQRDKGEKNAQVAIMGDIYESATSVMACIGLADTHSEKVFRFAPEISRLVAGLQGLLERRGQFFEFFSDMKIAIDLWKQWALAQGGSAVQDLCEQYFQFCKRPYFRRLWILQEIFAGRDDTILLAGTGMVRLRDVRDLSLAIGYCLREFAGTSYEALTAGDDFDNMYQVVHRRWSFDEAIAIFGSFLCKDPRDRIFGTLKLTDWDDDTPPQPDYDVSAFDLAISLFSKSEDTRVFNASISRSIVRALQIGVQDTQIQDWTRARLSSSTEAAFETLPPQAWLQELDYAFIIHRADDGRLIVAPGRSWNGHNVHVDLSPFRYSASSTNLTTEGSRIVYDGMEPLCHVPLKTQQGDLVVILSYAELVVRYLQDSDSFTLIGSAEFFKDTHRRHIMGFFQRSICDCAEIDKDSQTFNVVSMEFELTDQDMICALAAGTSDSDPSVSNVLNFSEGAFNAWFFASSSVDHPLQQISLQTLLNHFEHHMVYGRNFNRELLDLAAGDYFYLNGRPCVIADVSLTPREFHFKGLDLFNGNEEVETISRFGIGFRAVPRPFYEEYITRGVQDGQSVRLLGSTGVLRTDLQLPTDERLRQRIVSCPTADDNLIVTVLRVEEEEAVVSVRSPG
ncbi:hypothetical protein AC579_5870 [Pseudocercospora musae]|uniref:Heterokaryon incompatibility domain-containing protein n=1 Tax=Pseudocercospora musae TaxID=113226 RepID=A0A139HX80_9PEZI|nr:hypothetical protein AC579_5870 [Pseudocercospora musae]